MITVIVPRRPAESGSHCDATMKRRPVAPRTVRVTWGGAEWAYRESPRGLEMTVPHDTRRKLIEDGSVYLGSILCTGVVLRLGR